MTSRVTGASCWLPSTKYTVTGSVVGSEVVVGPMVVVVCGGSVLVVVVLVVVVSARAPRASGSMGR